MQPHPHLPSLVLGVILLCASSCSQQAESTPRTTEPAEDPIGNLFPEEVLARGRNLKITRSELDEAFIALKANKASLGVRLDARQRTQLEAQLLEKMVHTRLLLQEATEADREKGRKFVEEQMKALEEQTGSPEGTRQHIIASGVTVDYFKEQLLEEGITREVIRREVVGSRKISEAEVKKYHEENQAAFTLPERARIRHIFLSLVVPRTGAPLPEDMVRQKEELMKSLEDQVRKGADFAELALQYSEDPLTRSKGGEIVMIKGQSALELEIPVFNLAAGATSKIINTPRGLHLVRMLERHPEKLRPLDTVTDFIRNRLELDYIGKHLPPYLESLKEKAGLELANRPDE